jgi:membrane protein DedA with SNARE-associated domain
MNSAQARVAWVVVILLSLCSVGIGIWDWYDKYFRAVQILLYLVVPILLIGGLAFYRAKEKADK